MNIPAITVSNDPEWNLDWRHTVLCCSLKSRSDQYEESSQLKNCYTPKPITGNRTKWESHKLSDVLNGI